MIAKLVRPEIIAMDAIDWGEVPEDTPFRLMYGENPESVSVYRDAIIAEIDRINLYPSGTKRALRECLEAYTDVPADQIVVTNGSGEALELIAKVFIEQGDEVVIPRPSFPYFASDSEMMGADVRYVDLEADFSLDPRKVLAATTQKTKVVWIANPNNPTGNVLLTEKQIASLAQQLDCLLVIDECYYEFAKVTATSLLAKYPNIVIVRSFSKVFGLAGLRLGYIMGAPEAANYLRRLQSTNQVFSVNRFAQAAGIAVLSNPGLLAAFVEGFTSSKAAFEGLLARIPLEVYPTKTAFCIAKLPGSVTGAELKDRLKQEGILIKDCSIYPGFGEQYIYLGVPARDAQEACVALITSTIKELL